MGYPTPARSIPHSQYIIPNISSLICHLQCRFLNISPVSHPQHSVPKMPSSISHPQFFITDVFAPNASPPIPLSRYPCPRHLIPDIPSPISHPHYITPLLSFLIFHSRHPTPDIPMYPNPDESHPTHRTPDIHRYPNLDTPSPMYHSRYLTPDI